MPLNRISRSSNDSAQWTEQIAALSGSPVPRPQFRIALAAADVDGTFMRAALGRYSDRKLEHCPKAWTMGQWWFKCCGYLAVNLLMTHDSLHILQFDTTSDDQTVLDREGDLTPHKNRFSCFVTAE